jgi:cytoskeletal protein CcmA (bactofilin family)
VFGVKVENKLDTVIGADTEIKGDLSVRSSLRLDGHVEGNVSAMDSLFMGKGSYVKGEVFCNDAVIGGKIEGNLTARGVVELQSGSTLLGDVKCKSLVLDKDAFLDGRVKMSEEPAAAEPPRF